METIFQSCKKPLIIRTVQESRGKSPRDPYLSTSRARLDMIYSTCSKYLVFVFTKRIYVYIFIEGHVCCWFLGELFGKVHEGSKKLISYRGGRSISQKFHVRHKFFYLNVGLDIIFTKELKNHFHSHPFLY